MTYREADNQDTAQLLRMTRGFLGGSAFGTLIPYNEDRVHLLIEMVFELGTIFVAETDALKLVGMLALARVPHLISGEFYAEEQAWWVDPEWRNSRVGPKMLWLAESWALQKGCRMLKMGAPAGTTVGAFYERLGFAPVETAYIKVLDAVHDTRPPGAGSAERVRAADGDSGIGPGRERRVDAAGDSRSADDLCGDTSAPPVSTVRRRQRPGR